MVAAACRWCQNVPLAPNPRLSLEQMVPPLFIFWALSVELDRKGKVWILSRFIQSFSCHWLEWNGSSGVVPPIQTSEHFQTSASSELHVRVVQRRIHSTVSSGTAWFCSTSGTEQLLLLLHDLWLRFKALTSGGAEGQLPVWPGNTTTGERAWLRLRILRFLAVVFQKRHVKLASREDGVRSVLIAETKNDQTGAFDPRAADNIQGGKLWAAHALFLCFDGNRCRFLSQNKSGNSTEFRCAHACSVEVTGQVWL